MLLLRVCVVVTFLVCFGGGSVALLLVLELLMLSFLYGIVVVSVIFCAVAVC